MHSNFFLFLYSVLFHTVHICTASIHSEFSILMLQTISLIMLCSASLLFTVLLFLHFFIPLCSPITFLKAHCPVTKSYCIHHFSVFYFLSATDNIFLTFVTLVTRWANCLDFKSASCKTDNRIRNRTSAILLFVVHLSALNYSCWKGIGPHGKEPKQNSCCGC